MNTSLRAAARMAAAQSYSPYSHFPVGAAVCTSSGRIFTGCNIENASYGLTICAERVALFSAVAAGESEIVALVVSCVKGDTSMPSSLMPCGACRQVMQELLNDDAVIDVDGLDGHFNLQDLLPNGFKLQ